MDNSTPQKQYRWIGLAEFCADQGIKPGQATRWFAAGWRSGRVPQFVKPGKSYRIREDWYETWIALKAAEVAGQAA